MIFAHMIRAFKLNYVDLYKQFVQWRLVLLFHTSLPLLQNCSCPLEVAVICLGLAVVLPLLNFLSFLYVPWMHSQYLSLGLNLCNFDHWIQSEVLAILLVHLAVHPHHGVVQLLAHPSHLQLIQVNVLLILLEDEQVNEYLQPPSVLKYT